MTPSVGPSGSLGHEHAEAPIDPDIALPASGFYARVEPSPATLPAGVLTDQGGVPFDMTDVTRGVDVGEITVDAEIREFVDDGMAEADEEM